ncbi:hypothetical protein SAMN05216288_3905 [Pseudomonas punonensis]|uniref:Uncharacterized protein n=1 Tax=Phytopseudomonas punonensis TaxID=1220495 RepID=A0A1M7K063_9GAMM|nr:hypothetical protein SAMN05216288_3905 [Pseudomonas punonensis]
MGIALPCPRTVKSLFLRALQRHAAILAAITRHTQLRANTNGAHLPPRPANRGIDLQSGSHNKSGHGHRVNFWSNLLW